MNFKNGRIIKDRFANKSPRKVKNLEFRNYVKSLGFVKSEKDYREYINSDYSSIVVWICFFPCPTGVLILKNDGKKVKNRLYQDRYGDLEKFKEELEKYKDE